VGRDRFSEKVTLDSRVPECCQPSWSASPLNMGADRLSQNVSNYQPTLRNVPEKRRTRLQGGGSLKSRQKNVCEVKRGFVIGQYGRKV
jgi:hypothetical protein